MQHLFRERRSAVLLTDAFLAPFRIGLCVIEAAAYRTAVLSSIYSWKAIKLVVLAFFATGLLGCCSLYFLYWFSSG